MAQSLPPHANTDNGPPISHRIQLSLEDTMMLMAGRMDKLGVENWDTMAIYSRMASNAVRMAEVKGHTYRQRAEQLNLAIEQKESQRNKLVAAIEKATQRKREILSQRDALNHDTEMNTEGVDKSKLLCLWQEEIGLIDAIVAAHEGTIRTLEDTIKFKSQEVEIMLANAEKTEEAVEDYGKTYETAWTMLW